MMGNMHILPESLEKDDLYPLKNILQIFTELGNGTFCNVGNIDNNAQQF